MARPRIGQLLMSQGLCDRETLMHAWEQKVLFGDRLGTNLLAIGAVDERGLAMTLGVQSGVHAAWGEVIAPTPQAKQMLSPLICKKHSIVPHHVDGEGFYYLSQDPLDRDAATDVRNATNLRPVPVVVCEARMWELLNEHYGVAMGMRPIDLNSAQARLRAAQQQQPQQAAVGGELTNEEEFYALYANAAAEGGIPGDDSSDDGNQRALTGSLRTDDVQEAADAPLGATPVDPTETQRHDVEEVMSVPMSHALDGIEALEPVAELEPLPAELPSGLLDEVSASHTTELMTTGIADLIAGAADLPVVESEHSSEDDAILDLTSVADGSGEGAPAADIAPVEVTASPAPTPAATTAAAAAPAPATSSAVFGEEPEPAPEATATAAPAVAAAPSSGGLFAKPGFAAEIKTNTEGLDDVFDPLPAMEGDLFALGDALVDDTPLSFDEATEALKGVRGRSEIARVVLRYAVSKFSRAALLTVHPRNVLGWEGIGEDLTTARLSTFRLSRDEKSVFALVAQSRAHYIGPLQRWPGNGAWVKHTGRKLPQSVAVFPVLVRGNVVNLLYGDNGHGAHVESDVGELLILAQRIADSYESLIRR